MDLWHELELKMRQLGEAVKKLLKTGTDYAEAEREYKILLRQEALRLRDHGEAVGMVNLTVYGIKDVAYARCKRDIAEATYKTNQELVNQIKLEIRILESQLEREWSIAK